MYRFYYDESEHSRSIGLNTITANNFYDNFITVIIGWKAEDEQKIQDKYLKFEQKYIERQHDGELKAIQLNPNNYVVALLLLLERILNLLMII